MIIRKTVIPATTPSSVYRIKPNPSVVDFGSLAVNHETIKTVSLVNTGNEPVRIHLTTTSYFPLSVTGSVFSLSDSVTINPSDSAQIFLKFRPLLHYHYSAELSITSDSISIIKVPISGFGYDGIMGTLLTDSLICKDTLRVLSKYTIGPDAKLTICAGTKVIIFNEADIEVKGRLVVVGDSLNPIDFETESPQLMWGGIRFNHSKSDTSEFKYCTFIAPCLNGLMFISDGNVVMDHCEIGNANFVKNTIYINESSNWFVLNSLTLKNSTISHINGYSIHNSGGPLYLYNNDIHHNKAEILSGPGIRGNIIAKNNRVHDNEGLGFYIYDDGVLTDNEIYNNAGGGVYVYWSNYVLLKNNIVYGNKQKGGIWCRSNHKVDIIQNLIFNNTSSYAGAGLLLIVKNDYYQSKVFNNTICNNQSVGYNGSNLSIEDYGKTKIKVQNNIIWDMTNSMTGINFKTLADIDLDYNCINLKSLASYGAGNIFEGPEFVHPTASIGASPDPGVYNWSLKRTSYCINAGNPELKDDKHLLDFAGNRRVFGEIVDIGAYEYQGFVRMHPEPDTSRPDTTKNVIDHIYPNPVGNTLNISLNSTDEVELIIYDLTSKFIMSSSFSEYKTIFVGNLSKGLYFYEIRKEQGLIMVGKFVKE